MGNIRRDITQFLNFPKHMDKLSQNSTTSSKRLTKHRKVDQRAIK